MLLEERLEDEFKYFNNQDTSVALSAAAASIVVVVVEQRTSFSSFSATADFPAAAETGSSNKRFRISPRPYLLVGLR